MIPLQRQERILDLLEEKGTVSLAELFDSLPVSHMTVRRDIKKLEEDGRVVSVQGGITLPVRMELDLAHRVKRELRSELKQRIAALAAERVKERDHVFLDAGTTCLAIARELLKQDLPAAYVTNHLEIARYLADHTSKRIHFIGGKVDSANLSTEGYAAAASLGQHNIDLAFVSASSFDLRGMSVTSEEKLAFKEAILRVSRTCILATDSSKYGRLAPFRAAPLTRFAELHTDTGLNAMTVNAIQDMGLKVRLAQTDGDYVGESVEGTLPSADEVPTVAAEAREE